MLLHSDVTAWAGAAIGMCNQCATNSKNTNGACLTSAYAAVTWNTTPFAFSQGVRYPA